MHIYTCYSPSHQDLFNRFFVPSLPDGYRLSTTLIEQKCDSGDYHSKNWAKAMKLKVRAIIGAIETEMTLGAERIFIFSDVDLIFLEDVSADLTERMISFDILTADDDDRHCTGFMAIRANGRTLKAWQWVEQRVERAKCDQIAFQQFVRFQSNPTWFDRLQRSWRNLTQDPLGSPEPVRVGLLPGTHYANYFHFKQKERCWDGVAKLELSKERLSELKVFHANFTVGMTRKIALLETLKDLLSQHGLPHNS